MGLPTLPILSLARQPQDSCLTVLRLGITSGPLARFQCGACGGAARDDPFDALRHPLLLGVVPAIRRGSPAALMKTSSIIRGRWLITVLGMACSSDPTGPDLGVEPAGDPTVEEVIPNSGFRGTTLDIRVIGSGYDDGTEVSFEEEGNPTDGIVTNSTEFVSEEELVANITIAEDAEPGAYDVVVLTTVRKRGIGLEAFIVSTVVVGTLPGGVHSTATDVNDDGEVVGFVQIGFDGEPGFDGQHATYWFGGTLEDLGRGQAFGISEDCAVGSCRVVGFQERAPVVWQREEGSWTSVVLTTESGRGFAWAINDRGDRIVGSSGGPVVWTETDGVWTLSRLPGEGGIASAINDIGQVAGTDIAGRAIVWDPAGTGWTVHELEPLPGDITAMVNGINNAGDVVGFSGDFQSERAVLWRKTAIGWGEPVDLVPPEIIGVTSSNAVDINEKGEIVGTFRDERLALGIGSKGFLWAPGIGLVGDLGIFEGRGTIALAINERNQIAGGNTELALLWTFSIE